MTILSTCTAGTLSTPVLDINCCLLHCSLFTIHLWSNYKKVNGKDTSSHPRPLTALSWTGSVIMIDTGLRHILLCGPILTVLHHQAGLNALKALICLNYNMALDLSPMCGWLSMCVCTCMFGVWDLKDTSTYNTRLSSFFIPVICPPIISVPSIYPIKGV